MFAYEVMSRRPISTNMLARTGSRRRSEMRAGTWLPTEIPGREPSSRGPNNGPIHAADEPVAQAGHKGEGHRMCKVGADDADGRQPRIEKEEHGHGSTNSAWSLSSAIAFQASLDVGWEGWVGSCVIRNAGEFNGFLKPKICLFAEPLRFAEGELILAPRTSPFIRKHRSRIRDYALARADNPTRISLRSGIRPAQNLVDSVRYA